MTEFCNACHGENAPGAATNVVGGIFDAGPTSGTGSPAGSYQYQSESTFGAALNGGGFGVSKDADTGLWEPSTSVHNMEAVGPLWGAGTAVPTSPIMTCTSCHDPHGTSNYRLLKAEVNGNTVGGYAADGVTPNAFVYSYETGYPNPQTGTEGWLKHEAGADQMAVYRPDYTGGTKILHTDATGEKSISIWCAGCHENYATREGNTDGTGAIKANGGVDATYNYDGSVGAPNSENGVVGAKKRHRHPVDVTLGAGWGPGRALQEQVVSDSRIPLELDEGNSVADPFYQNYIGCLTCHTAHGSSADMTGWAAASLTLNADNIVVPVQDGVPGVSPDKGGSALLRADNRGVCERCHNK
jgi:predicted CXXCH cytochrome family protein